MHRLPLRASGQASIRALTVVLLGVALFTVLLTINGAVAQSPNLVISQAYGGGGNAGATLRNDYIEIFNLGTTPVALNGYSVQYAAAAGTSWQVTALGDHVLQPGQYYLVQQAAGAGGTVNLPSPDAFGNIAMAAGAFKVALVNSTEALVGAGPFTEDPTVLDFVGVGTTANAWEGAGRAPALTNTTSIIRVDSCADTDNNAADFMTITADATAPRNRQTVFTPCAGAVDYAPFLHTSMPGNGFRDVLLNANLSFSFSEPVTVETGWLTISCQNTGIHTYSATIGPIDFLVNPDGDFVNEEICTATIDATRVFDTDGTPTQMEANAVVTFTTIEPDVCAADSEWTPIYTIQGNGPTAAVTGYAATRGVVVTDFQSGLNNLGGVYIQANPGDGDPATSDGIFIYTGNQFPMSVGQFVRVGGVVQEYKGQTEIRALNATICDPNGVLPAHTSVPMPFPAADTHGDYLERFEGMLVTFPQTLYVTEHFQLGRFNQVVVSSGDRLFQPTHVFTADNPLRAQLQAANDHNRIVLDDPLQTQNPTTITFARGGNPLAADNTLRGGDTVTGVAGIMTFTDSGNSVSGNMWRLRNVVTSTVPSFVAANPRPAPIERTTSLRVTAMNLLNFFDTFSGCRAGQNGPLVDCRGASDANEFSRQIAKTVSALLGTKADVIAISEIENDGHVAGSSAISRLVAEMNARSAPGEWAYINPDLTLPLNSLGSDAIKVGILYRPSMVAPVGVTAVLSSTAFVNGGDSGPRTRPALAQTFEQIATGGQFTVISNHFKSKGSACDNPDAGDGQGNCNDVRTAAANELLAWLATYPTGIHDDDVLILGDLNSYAMEDPIMTLKGAGYVDLAYVEAGTAAYSYVFDGQWGYLDYSLASETLAPHVAHAATWHINSDEPSVLDYTLDFKFGSLPTLLFAPDEFRTSDHDPVLVDLKLPAKLTVEIDGGATGGTGLVISQPRGYECTGHCETFVEQGAVILLTADPDSSSMFAGWQGDCSGTGACLLTLSEARSVTAVFELAQDLTVNFAGSGTGTVMSESAAVQCTETCNVRVVTDVPITLTATADSSSVFAGWTHPDTVNCAGTGKCRLAMNSTEIVVATFNLKQYTLSVTQPVSGNVTSVPAGINCGTGGSDCAKSAIPHGSTVTLTATPGAGYSHTGWTGDACASQTGACVVTMSTDTTVAPTFAPIFYTATVHVIGNGSVSSTPAGIACGDDCQESFVYGTPVTLAAAAQAGSHFNGWSGACSSEPCQLTMTENKIVTAIFKVNTYTVTVATPSNGKVTINPGNIVCDSTGATCTTVVAHNTVVTLAAEGNTGYHFSSWTSDCSGDTDSVCELTVTTNVTAGATFEINTYTLTTTTSGSGAGTLSSTSPTATHGSVITLTAMPAISSTLAGWSEAACGTASTCPVTMTGNKTVTATFDLKMFALTVATTGAGAVNPASGTHPYGTQVTLTATPELGWRFDGWSGACTGTGTCTVTMTSDQTVTANFVEEPLTPAEPTLTVTTVGNGAVTSVPAGIDCGADCTETFDTGTVVTLTATANTDATFAGWSGACTGAESTCVVTMNSNQAVTATFTSETVEIEITDPVGGGGRIEVEVIEPALAASTQGGYGVGTVLRLTAIPDQGYAFGGWTGDVASYGTQNPIQFTVTGPMSISANFTAIGPVPVFVFLPSVAGAE